MSPALQKLRALPHNPPVLPEGTRQPLTKELAARFFSLLSVCDTSIIQLLIKHPELPPYKTLYNWQQRVPWFGAMWKEARRAQAEFLIQQCIELARTATGKNAHAVRVRFDIYRFIAAKFNPDTYGDKLLPQQQSTTVNVGIAISQERLAELRAKLAQSRSAWQQNPPLANAKGPTPSGAP